MEHIADSDQIETICGRYSNGVVIMALKNGAAMVSRTNGNKPVPFGETRSFPNGFIFVLAGESENVLLARFNENTLTFSDRVQWYKLSAQATGPQIRSWTENICEAPNTNAG